MVIRADRDLNASRYWSNMTASIAERKLRDAQALFISAARSRLVGFYKQPMRRILRAIAIRLSGQPENSWMRRVWFSAGEAPEHGWDREYNASLSSVLQDLTNWDKRSRHDEGKDTVPWDSVLGTRRYPTAVLEPDRNPYHEGLASAYYPGAIKKTPNVDIEESVQLLRYLGFLDERPSGFSLDFTTSADCRGAGIAPYGEGVFPPVTVSSHPGKNFDYLPFPLQATSCQPMMISRTSDNTRPAVHRCRYCHENNAGRAAEGLLAAGILRLGSSTRRRVTARNPVTFSSHAWSNKWAMSAHGRWAQTCITNPLPLVVATRALRFPKRPSVSTCSMGAKISCKRIIGTESSPSIPSAWTFHAYPVRLRPINLMLIVPPSAANFDNQVPNALTAHTASKIHAGSRRLAHPLVVRVSQWRFGYHIARM